MRNAKTHTSEACQGSIPKSSYQAEESQMEDSEEFLTVKTKTQVEKHTKDDAETETTCTLSVPITFFFKQQKTKIKKIKKGIKNCTNNHKHKKYPIKSHKPETEWSPFESTFLAFPCHHKKER